jgi:hypothetical protein
VPLLKLKTKQAKVVIVGEGGEGNERRRGEKVEIEGERMKKWEDLGEIREEGIRRSNLYQDGGGGGGKGKNYLKYENKII